MSYSSSCHHHLHQGIRSSNNIQNGDILVPVYPGCPEKLLLNMLLLLLVKELHKNNSN